MARNFRSIWHNHIWKLAIFVFLLTANLVIFYKTYRKYHEEAQYFYLHQMLGDSLCIARASAATICFNILAVMLSMCKTFVSSLRNLVSKLCVPGIRKLLDEKKSMHILCGLMLCLLSIVHTVAHCINNFQFNENFNEEHPGVNLFPKKEQMGKYSVFFTTTGATGLLMLVILVLMFTSSIPSVRRQNYVIFWYTHHLAFPFIGLLLLHSYGCIIKRQKNLIEHWPGCVYTNETNRASNSIPDDKVYCRAHAQFDQDPAQAWKWIIVPLVLYIFDRLIRRWRGSKHVDIKKAIWHEGNVIELQLVQHGFAAQPGQFIQIQCPEIANFEWHPFTLTKCSLESSKDDHFSVHVKVVGKWTETLASQLFTKSKTTSSRKQSLVQYSKSQSGHITKLVKNIESLRIFVDGPYGSPCQDVTAYPISICIAAGIGVTPFAAVINSLRFNIEQGKLRRLYFIWVSRKMDDFHWFLQLLYDFNQELIKMNKPDLFVCKFYLTGKSDDIEKGTYNHIHNLSTDWLSSRLQFGRPAWEDVFNSISQNHKSLLQVIKTDRRLEAMISDLENLVV
ncbi:NADPH oxidase 4-like isoform X2 [Rhopilema esculentum]|uniref:NADPH oxidase 4-like isoform X2 n=1 Tax=Rhopilema esculentum TaxID=499914 RepID=UPI0031E1A658